jgi:hypothetical protein
MLRAARSEASNSITNLINRKQGIIRLVYLEDKSAEEFLKLFRSARAISWYCFRLIPEVCTVPCAPLNSAMRLEFGKGKLRRDCRRTTAP